MLHGQARHLHGPKTPALRSPPPIGEQPTIAPATSGAVAHRRRQRPHPRAAHRPRCSSSSVCLGRAHLQQPTNGSTPSPPVADPRASTTSRPISSDPTPPSRSQIRDDASAPALIHLRRRREQQPPSVRKIQPPHNVHGPPDAPSSTTRPHLLRQQHTAPPISVFPCQLRRRHNGPPRPIISDHNAHPSQIQAARQPVPQPISRTSHGQHNPATTWAIKIKQFKSIEHLQKATRSHA